MPLNSAHTKGQIQQIHCAYNSLRCLNIHAADLAFFVSMYMHMCVVKLSHYHKIWLTSTCAYSGKWKGTMHLIKDMCLWGIATPTNGRACDLYCMYWTTARELVHLNAKLRRGDISTCRSRQDDECRQFI